MINKLLVQGIEIQEVTKPFTTASGMTYGAGSYFVTMAQPKMGLSRDLMGRTVVPDNEWTRNKDGSPIRPYDMSTDTMYEFMGVRVDPVSEVVQPEMHKLTGPVESVGKISKGSAGYTLDGRQR